LPDLVELYPLIFETRLVRTPQQLVAAQEVRYRAYCEERRLMDAAQFPEQRENDVDDARSVHVLLVLLPTGSVVGTVRLVLPAREASARLLLPVERVAAPGCFESVPGFDRESSAEVSRLCLTREAAPSRKSDDTELRYVQRHAMVGLVRGLVSLSREHGVEGWCAMTAPVTRRRLTWLGIHFASVGEPIEHYGPKQPLFSPFEALLETVRKERPDVWELITLPL